MILTELWKSKEDSAVCVSTEEMIAEMKKENSVQVENDLVVGSADVKALYPSLDIDFTIEKVCDIFFESDVQVEGVDYEEVGLYLAINIEPEVLQRSNITYVCPTRRSKRGRRPTITASGTEEKKEKRFKPWNLPKKQADERAKRLMLREALHVALSVIMKNHVYTFNNEIKKQTKGGPIGLKLTGVLAQIFMIWWDREFACRLKVVGIVQKMNLRYVDDINVAAKATVPGLRYVEGKIVMDTTKVEEDEKRTSDERTMELIRQVGDDIHPSIKLEVDYRSKHPDEKLPILDLKAYRARQEAELKGERPIHRPKGWRRNKRETEKSKKKEDWYKKGGNEAVIFVPATPGSRLQKEYQREIRDQGYRIKVVEKTGTTLKAVLQKSDPFKRQRCGREDCLVCKQAGKGPCNAHGVTYDIECQGCKDKYIGETARNAYTRDIEHTGGLENQDDGTCLTRLRFQRNL
ncbi:hypothetical protein ACROYT_G013708 [Oculina patagonica]